MAEEVERIACFPAEVGEYLRSIKSSPRLLSTKRCLLSTVFLFSFIFLTGTFISWFDVSIMKSVPFLQMVFTSQEAKMSQNLEYSLNCSNPSMSRTCTSNNYTFNSTIDQLSSKITCPEHFRWIHEDLKPWNSKGITRDILERAKEFAYFKVVIVEGKVYVEKYKKCFQTRDMFTVWGILQLLKLYPGKIPDLELMFNCGDRPTVGKQLYEGHNATSVPPMFQYCGRDDSFGIVFPDWTFWGWPETNIRPWKFLLEDIREGNKRIKWEDRTPFAYWKGNPSVNHARGALMSCNVSQNSEWDARLYRQDWNKAARQGYKDSKLEDQCTHRYKIYIEGRGWSVSEKYILACDSMVLLVKPQYFDFFTRSMVPLQHYWHISDKNMCRHIKFAVEWGNNHTNQAKGIGNSGSKFIQENLSMDYVYDYMFHTLNEYAKLLKFQPTVPKGAKEVCSGTMTSSEMGLCKEFMLESIVKYPSNTLPCNMPPPYDTVELKGIVDKRENITRQVEAWVNQYWKH